MMGFLRAREPRDTANLILRPSRYCVLKSAYIKGGCSKDGKRPGHDFISCCETGSKILKKKAVRKNFWMIMM